MPTRTITRTVISLSLAGVVLGLTLTAILPAAYGQVINACVNTKTGALHILTSGTCKAGESPISWGITGPKGDKGDPGTPGTNGLNASAEPCNPDSVKVGTTCVDKYEASVWEVPPANTGLIAQIKKGTVTHADLTAGGAIQRGVAGYDYGAGCPDTGNGCTNFYAVSIPGVRPSSHLTWFQAAAAARNAGKRLPTNAEWQAAALGTPDTGGADNGTTTCNTDSTFAVESTGSRSGCVSDVGAFDMVGNVWEWVADWVPRSTACITDLFGTGDLNCLAGASITGGPGALLRGGNSEFDGAGPGSILDFGFGTRAGVFAVNGAGPPSFADITIGFRCAR